MKNKMTKEDAMNRVVARGEHSNHSHVIVGNAKITRNGDVVTLEPQDDKVFCKHLMETEWLNGNEVWTQEHYDAHLPQFNPDGSQARYQYIAATEFSPFDATIQRTKD